jgi:hypothetical protein
MKGFVAVLPDLQAGISGMSDQVKLATVAFTGLALATGAAATAIAVTIGGPAALAVAGLGIQVAAVTAAILSNFGQIGSAIAAWTGDTQINFSTVLKWIGMGADGFAVFARSVLVGVDMIGTALVVMGKAFMGAISMLQGFATSAKGVLTFDPTQIVTGIAQMQGAWTKFDVGVSTQIRAFNQRLKTNLQDTVDNINGKYANGFQSAGVKIGAAFTKAANSVQEYVGKVEGLVKKGQAATEGVMGAGGAKKGKDETEKILKEQLDFVNDWVKQTEFAVTLNLAVWKKLGPGVKETLLEASAAFRQSINDAQTWAATLQAAFINAANGNLGKSLIVKLKGTKITIEDPVIDLKSDVNKLLARSGLSTEGLKIPARIEFGDNEKFKDAAQRTYLDLLKIQTDSEDARKAAAAKHAEEIRKQGEENNKKILDNYKKTYDELKSIVGDGMAGILSQIAKATGVSLGRMTEVTDGVLDIIGGLPGKIGDKLRGATDKFLTFVNSVDRVFKGLHKIFDAVPDGISGMLSKVVGLFKNASSGVGGGGIFGAIGGFFGKIFGGGGGTGAAGTGISEGMASNASKGGGILSGLGGALGIAGIGASLLPAIIGLFKGKSQIQKDTEKAQLDQLKAGIAQTYEDIKSTMIDSIGKGVQVLEAISVRTDTSRKAIRRAVNQVFLLLEEFAEASKGLAPKGLEAAKAVTDNVGGAFDLMLNGLNLNNAIQGMKEATEQDVKALGSSMTRLLDEILKVMESVELQAAKQGGKKSERLKPVIELFTAIPDAIKAAIETPKISDDQLNSAFSTARQFLNTFFKFNDELIGYALNKGAKGAGQIQSIFESGKSIFEVLGMFTNYKAADSSIFGVVTNDLQKLLNWMDATTEQILAGLDKSETLQDALSKLSSSLSGVRAGIGSALGLGGSGSSSSITASIVRQDGAQFATRQGGSTPSITNVTNNFNQTFNASSEDALVRRIRDEVRKEMEEQARKLRLGSMSN